MDGTDPNWDQIRVEGKNYARRRSAAAALQLRVAGILHTAGTRLVAGRDFTWADMYGVRPMVIVSEGLARESWGSPPAAIGKRFREFSSMPWHEVVGVVQDVRENGVDQVAPATVYWPSIDDATHRRIRTSCGPAHGLLRDTQQSRGHANASSARCSRRCGR